MRSPLRTGHYLWSWDGAGERGLKRWRGGINFYWRFREWALKNDIEKHLLWIFTTLPKYVPWFYIFSKEACHTFDVFSPWSWMVLCIAFYLPVCLDGTKNQTRKKKNNFAENIIDILESEPVVEKLFCLVSFNVRHPNILNVTTHSKPFPSDGIHLRRG